MNVNVKECLLNILYILNLLVDVIKNLMKLKCMYFKQKKIKIRLNDTLLSIVYVCNIVY